MTPKEWAALLHAKMSDMPVEWGSDGDEIALFTEYFGAALRERDAAWRTAVREADSCASDDGAYGLHLAVINGTYAQCRCAPLRALLEEAGK